MRAQRTAVHLEYIVVDGGSTDGTLALLDGDDVDLWISEPDEGIYDAMNKGVALARGDIVVLINADDQLLPGALAAVCERFADCPACGVVYGDAMLGTVGGRPDIRFRPPARLSRRDWHTIPTPHPAMIVRRSVYERIGLFRTELRLAADHEFLLRAFLSGERFEYVARPLAAIGRGGLSERQAERYRAETRRTIDAYGLGPLTNFLHWMYVTKWWMVYVAERSGVGRIALSAYRAVKSLRGGGR